MISNNFDRVGRTLGPEVEQRKLASVGIALEQLEKELLHLNDLVHQLDGRLCSVMRPDVAISSSADDGVLGRPMSPLAYELERLCKIARETSASAFSIVDRLEL